MTTGRGNANMGSGWTCGQMRATCNARCSAPCNAVHQAPGNETFVTKRIQRTPKRSMCTFAARILAAFAFVLCAAPRHVDAQMTKDTVSAPVRDLHYDVTFTRSDAQSRSVEVSLTMV